MCCKCAETKSRAFTLLEVLLAVMMIALVMLSIYRFVELNLQAIFFSTEQNTEAVRMETLTASLQAQLDDLPSPQAMPGALTGEPHKFRDLPADEMRWIAGAGIGLFTSHASGEYEVTLRLKPDPEGKTADLGLRRVLIDGDENQQNWLPLLREVQALEIRYFDKNLNAWLEKWTETRGRPSLVRVRIWRRGEEDPHEVILPVSRGVMATGGAPTRVPAQRPGERGTPGGVQLQPR